MGESSRRRLAAIMFADMVGYTAHMQDDENRARARRDRFVQALDEAVRAHHGETLQHYGDGAVSVFDSAVEAVEAAVALQRALGGQAPIAVRVGIHAGDVVYGEDGVYGDGMNVAARIEPLAAPGGVMITGKVYDDIKNHPALSAIPRGEIRLKNVKRPVRVFAISSEGLAVPSPEEVRGKAWVPDGPVEPTEPGVLDLVGERSLIQWGLAYLAGAWAFLEAAGFAEGAFHWPTAVSRALVVAAVAGLPLTLVLAWYHGQRGRQRVTGVEILLVGLLLAVSGAVMARVGPEPGAAFRTVREAGVARDLPSIAVLPFANMSGTSEAEPFAVGIHDDILTQLSKISGLRVISRTSVLGYRDSRLSVPEIARELGVGAILEGGVQRVNDRIRLNAQLVDGETDAHLWAERYDTVYTVENVFAIQSALASAIADALETVLTPAEEENLGAPPTDDPEAYERYLHGLERMARPGWAAPDLAMAQQDFEEAVAADPGFALAWANLAAVHFLMHRVAYDPTPERIERVRETAERALEEDPGLPEAHMAMSHYHTLKREMAPALTELAAAGRGLPNDPWVPVGVAMIRQRQGAWEEAARELRRAIRLDPRNPEFTFLLADNYAMRRQWDEAIRQFERTLSLAPGMMQARAQRALVEMFRDGDPRPMLEAAEAIPAGGAFGATPAFFVWWGRFLLRDFEGSEIPLDSVPSPPTGWPTPYTPALLRALSRWHDGRIASARSVLADELPRLEEAVRLRPEEPGPHQTLGLAYAVLGRDEEAVREGLRATELLPVSRDAYDGPAILLDLARTYATTGRVDDAVDQLELLLSIPSAVSRPFLAMDPGWDPLRGDPRFQALVEGVPPDGG